MEKLTIFDTTLRDGEQSPGASLTEEQKVRLARALEDFGVDVIEAGFPVASKQDFDAVVAIAERTKRATVCGLARLREADISRAQEALKGARRSRLHLFIATSPAHMAEKLKMTPRQVLDVIEEFVANGSECADEVEFSAEDAAASDLGFLCEAFDAAFEAGARILNVPATTGVVLPTHYASIFRHLRARRSLARAVLSAHCHDDIGLAVANSLAAVEAGARQVEGTIIGIGERAGNAALEEIGVAVRLHAAHFGCDTDLDLTQCQHIAQLVSAATGFVIPPNKAIVGANAHAHESGIHQHAAILYEAVPATMVGAKPGQITLSDSSGRAGVRSKLAEYGVVLEEDAFADLFARFMCLAEQQKEVSDDELLDLLEDRAAAHHGPYEGLQALYTGDSENAARSAIDACIRAAEEGFKSGAQLVNFQVQSAGEGTAASAIVFITLTRNGVSRRARARDTDSVVAALKAYVNALNELARAEAQ